MLRTRGGHVVRLEFLCWVVRAWVVRLRQWKDWCQRTDECGESGRVEKGHRRETGKPVPQRAKVAVIQASNT